MPVRTRQYRKELERMLQVKADNMVIFIRKERDEIEYLWNELFYSEDERRRFGLFDSGELRFLL